MAAMKWSGWGDDGVAFTHEDKPGLGPFLQRALDLDVYASGGTPGGLRRPRGTGAGAAGRRSPTRSPPRPARSPRTRWTASSTRAARACATSCATAAASSAALPDAVVRPDGEDAVAAVMRAALEHDAVLIPFGGGTSISGSLEVPPQERAPGHLARPREAAAGAGDRRRVRPGARAGRSARPRPRAPARRAGLDARALPRLLHPLDARRLDRHALLGDAVRPLRRHRRPRARGPRRHAGGAARHAPGAAHLDRPQRARDGARQRGAPRRDHRGDRAGAPRARAPRDPRLPVPDAGPTGWPPCTTSPRARRRRR